METNNVITAPQLDGVEKVYKKWKENHTGSLKTFYTFITTPSPQRDDFINSLEPVTVFNGAVASVTVKL